jgi:hypothetical protein
MNLYRRAGLILLLGVMLCRACNVLAVSPEVDVTLEGPSGSASATSTYCGTYTVNSTCCVANVPTSADSCAFVEFSFVAAADGSGQLTVDPAGDISVFNSGSNCSSVPLGTYGGVTTGINQQFPVTVQQGVLYCLFIGSVDDSGTYPTGTTTVSYTLPAASVPSSGNGPMPLWAYALLGLAVWWIVGRQLTWSRRRDA